MPALNWTGSPISSIPVSRSMLSSILSRGLVFGNQKLVVRPRSESRSRSYTALLKTPEKWFLSINFEDQRIVQNLDYRPNWQASPFAVLYKHNTKSPNSPEKRVIIIYFLSLTSLI